MKKIAVIGTGYVGLIVGAGLSDFGNYVTCVDKDENKIENLKNGNIPIYEPGLSELFHKNLNANRLNFTTNISRAIRENEIIYITVGTPPTDKGNADLSSVIEVAKDVSRNLNTYKVIVLKSTVPVGTNKKIQKLIEETSGRKNFDVVSNPEFLREGKAVRDFFNPDRVIVGVKSEKAEKIIRELYRPFNIREVPLIFCNPEEAELIKYAGNAFLATKITFINEIANLCETVGADVHIVAKAIGMDGRIGSKFLHPGPGYGGSCFPKDTKALVKIGEKYGVDMQLVRQVIDSNENQKMRMVKKLKRLLGANLEGKKIGLLGLAFKADTDDIRESPAIVIINELLKNKALVKVHDPKAMNSMKKIFPNEIIYCTSEYEAAEGVDALVVLTEWNQYRGIDLAKVKSLMNGNIILDTRNILDPAKTKSFGFVYEGVGRK